ncbi:hypothetical protein [Alphaproteobacteria bacterium endosymbiont of Tiliacea citrago]|uniref:hypothetical protein n=1 Tax=Alphaproteobacteria bacterium endosymbiont of Tiliacea citrago TaxID=3077944 RepID=UPI00313B6733
MNYACALALLPMAATAFSIAKIICSYVDAMGRNPEMDKTGNGKTMVLIGIATVELVALLSFAIAFSLLGVNH